MVMRVGYSLIPPPEKSPAMHHSDPKRAKSRRRNRTPIDNLYIEPQTNFIAKSGEKYVTTAWRTTNSDS